MSRGSSSYRSISAARARPQQQTRRTSLLLSIDGTDRLTDGRTLDRFMTLPHTMRTAHTVIYIAIHTGTEDASITIISLFPGEFIVDIS